MDLLTLLGVNWDITVHLLHSFLSVPLVPYSKNWNIFAFEGELPFEGLPLVVGLQREYFSVRRVVRALSRADHVIHMEVVTPRMPCNMAGNIQDDTHKPACRGMTSVPPDGASRLLVRDKNIMGASKVLFKFLTIRVPPYDKALDWL